MRFVALIFAMTCLYQTTSAVVKINSEIPKVEQASDFTPIQISTFSKTQIEQRLGRKLTLKEKIGIVIVKKQIKKYKKNGTSDFVPMDGFAIAGFILSVVSFFILGIPLGILGVILSGVGYGRVNRSGGKLKGRGLAMAGIILGLLGLLILGAFIVSSTDAFNI